MTQTMVSLRGIYKIFGPNDKELLHHVQNGMGKEELMEKYEHILALNNINIDIQAEKTFKTLFFIAEGMIILSFIVLILLFYYLFERICKKMLLICQLLFASKK